MKDNIKERIGVVLKVIAYVLWIAAMYYIFLPALNLKSLGLWWFIIIFVFLLPACFEGVYKKIKKVINRMNSYDFDFYDKRNYISNDEMTRTQAICICGIVLMVGILIICSIIGSKMFNAKKYASILKAEECDFYEDIGKTTELSQIPLMDTDSAIILGDREIGGLSEVVSQYEVSEYYTQINYNNMPKKISALDYAGFFKYQANKNEGIPGYVQVDPVEQNANYVELEESMHYVPSAFFSKDIFRYLTFKYPTKIFDDPHFEIDDDGKPFYIASVYDYTIGLFGGKTVVGVIICDPVTGECKYRDVSDVPKWVDLVFGGDLLVEQYNWNGILSGGYFNSIFSKKGCKETTSCYYDGGSTSDFGYIAKDNDIWIYTGVTSLNDDASNIGFVLINERTAEARYYSISGADESSAMSAAEGEVQEKGYLASFPSLINVDDNPTYVMVLKDNNGIVKLYAMVNVESYNIVTTAVTLDECFANYRKLIGGSDGNVTSEVIVDEDNTNKYSEQQGNTNNDKDVDLGNTEEADDSNTLDSADTVSETVTITDIKYIDIDGNTYVYIVSSEKIYKQKFADDESIIFLKVGDVIEAECVLGEDNIYQMKKFSIIQ